MQDSKNSPPYSSTDQRDHSTNIITTHQNLCDIFFQELGEILASAEIILATADAIDHHLPKRWVALHDIVREASETAGRCKRKLQDIFDHQSIPCVSCANSAIIALLDNLSLENRDNLDNSSGVAGTRLISVLRKASLQMELQISEASEYAFLLGAEVLCKALGDCAREWAACAAFLHSQRTGFCAEAYMAGIKEESVQSIANKNHNPQPNSSCFAGLLYSSSLL